MIQTATTIAQSKKLIELGIDIKTCDFAYFGNNIYPTYGQHAFANGVIPKDVLSAWSLSALLNKVIPKNIPDGLHSIVTLTIETLSDGRWSIEYIGTNICSIKDDLITACIDLIEQLVEKGYIKTKKKE